MKPSPSILRRIRSALRLADDARAPNGESKSAARMAAKLIKKFKVRDEDLWDDDKDYDAKPGTWSRRVAITIGQSDDRVMIATRITMFRHPAVRMFLWESKITPEAGAMEFVADSNIVKDASEFWIKL